MSGKLEVSFNSPQCGWMSIGFDDGVNEFHTTTAHTPHEAALAALLSILTGLLDAETGENESVLEWNRDPEEFDFRFIRDGENMTVEIREYADGERQPDSGELMFSHTGDRREVCNAFAETFEQLYADRDTDEFEFNWRQPFPFAEYATFQEAMNRLQ